MKYALGFDMSLVASAAVALPLNWRPGDWRRAKFWLFKPKQPKNDDVYGQLVRYGEIRAWAMAALRAVGCPRQYAIEAYAFSKNNAQASRLMELGGIVRYDAYLHDMLPIVVAAASARKTLFGKCPLKDPKLRVQVALDRAGAPKAWEENLCDAFVIANHLLATSGGKGIFLGDAATLRHLDKLFPPPAKKSAKKVKKAA